MIQYSKAIVDSPLVVYYNEVCLLRGQTGKIS